MSGWRRSMAAAGALAASGYLLATLAAGSGRAAGPVLDARVGPGFTISLTQGGVPVTTLAPGDYTIDVDDMASIHNFHLQGPGVDEATSIPGTGTDTWDVTLSAGQYTFQCDAHSPSMNGSFTVATAPATSTTSSTSSTTSTVPPPVSTTTATSTTTPTPTSTTTTTSATATTPTSTTTTTTTTTSPPPAPPLVQSVSVRVQRRHTVVVRVDLSKPAMVRARLIRRGRTLAAARRQVGTKPTALTLHAPRAGRYTVEVVAGGRRILRTVTLPA